MTITLELPEATFTALQEEAGAQGRSAEQIAAEHLAAFYAEVDEDTALQEAMDELEAGQGRPFSEFTANFSTRFAASHPLK